MFNKTSIEYRIIEECKCASAEYFVLIQFVDFRNYKNLALLNEILTNLVNDGFLQCELGNSHVTQINLEDLNKYIQIRNRNNEALDEHPECCEEYRFTATQTGISLLNKEDKPIFL